MNITLCVIIVMRVSRVVFKKFFELKCNMCYILDGFLVELAILFKAIKKDISMREKKISVLAKYKGVYHGTGILLATHLYTKGNVPVENKNVYTIDPINIYEFEDILEVGETYKISGNTHINNNSNPELSIKTITQMLKV